MPDTVMKFCSNDGAVNQLGVGNLFRRNDNSPEDFRRSFNA
jgi:hypothetical protein